MEHMLLLPGQVLEVGCATAHPIPWAGFVLVWRIETLFANQIVRAHERPDEARNV